MTTSTPDCIRAYRPPQHGAPIDLDLSGGERTTECAELPDLLAGFGPDILRRYPHARDLELQFAERIGVAASSVYVTAGADEAIDRVCRAQLGPGDSAVCPWPCFEMIPRYVALAGARLHRVDWTEGAFPIQAILDQAEARTRLVVAVSPNNPTGAVVHAAEIERLARSLPSALVLVDQAYSEFAATDLTAAVLRFPNVVVTRTLSKAWGLAGLRVGFAIGRPEVIDQMRAAGGPYSVSGPSLFIAGRALECGEAAKAAYVSEVRDERTRLEKLAPSLAWTCQPSQGNFVLWRGSRSAWLRDGLAGMGVAVRVFPAVDSLADAVRITCPGDGGRYRRLERALRTVLRPQAVLFDMDGVLADVSASYRAAIVATARAFAVELRAEEIDAEKMLGDANDDWALTHRMLRKRGVHVSLENVTRCFEAYYQGHSGRPGLRATESLLTSRRILERLRERVRLGIVTGRPRQDALRFLSEHGLEGVFDTVVCREDAPLKPDPAPLRLAMSRLSERGDTCERAWYVGDTLDDVKAARAAAVVPLGVVAPGSQAAVVGPLLLASGAARILERLEQLEELLP
ncbi:MAG: aminotransferase class I/II-fold pyridoxal phosphate-dependent enzyme [Nannocystaceae bacterium]